MSHVHAIVWLDHLNARIIEFSEGDGETIPIESASNHRQLHRKSGKPGSGHAPDDLAFFNDIAAAVSDVREILITGPGTAKVAFKRYVDDRHHDLTRRIVGVETVDHPSDGELLAYGRRYFRRVDQLGTFQDG
jgi:stalled ribosome rescue protein Dom34